MPRVFPAVLLPTGERLWLPVLLQGTAVPGLCLSLPSLSSGLFLGLGECEVASVNALKAFKAEEVVLLCELVGWEILCRVFGARVGKGSGCSWDVAPLQPEYSNGWHPAHSVALGRNKCILFLKKAQNALMGTKPLCQTGSKSLFLK